MRERPSRTLPYAAPDSLPLAIRAGLSPQLQQLYVDAFSDAWHRYAHFADREAFCHRLARSALRWHRRYRASPPSNRDARVVNREKVEAQGIT